MSRKRTTPADVILDLLRSAKGRRQSASALIRSGALFGFPENTIRVTLSRLMARGRIESPRRGLYQLSAETGALNDFVERWRLGEARVRPWPEDRWLFAHGDASHPASRWALDALGFRSVRDGLQARPDNLALGSAELRNLAGGIGLATDVLLIAGEPLGEDTAPWQAAWTPATLNAEYHDALRRLETSAARLDTLPGDAARLECFRLGGEMIHRLAKDPLLPAEFVDVDAREALWRATLDYDRRGKDIWGRASHGELNHMPHPQLAATTT
jgi:phenylacetic acid degradation operon negative regulatory protein